MSSWRWIVVLGSVAGVAAVATVWSRLDDPGIGHLALCALPFLVGGASAIVKIDIQVLVFLLWLAAGFAGLVAALSFMSGAGLVLLAGVVLYLIAAWGMNEGASGAAR